MPISFLPVLALKRILFCEASPLIALGGRKILVESDIPCLPREADPRVHSVDESAFNPASGPEFFRSFLRASRPHLIRATVMNVAAASLSLVGPWALYAFVRSLAAGVEESESFMIALAFAGLLGIAGAASGVVMQHYFYRMLLAHQAITNALNRALFQHSLRITLASRARATVGEIVNRMSSDTDSLAEVPNVIAEGVGSATVLVGATASLFWLLGPSAGVAVASLALLAPLTRKIARDFSRLEEEMSERRDERVTLLSQALSSIRVVKCFVWEGAIARETGRVRTLELSARRRLARAESAATVAYVATSSLVLFGALAAFAALGGHLEPAVVFAAVALFGALEEPIGNLSRVVSRATNALVGADRIARFLRSDALPDALPEALGVESVGSAPRAFEPTGVRLSSLTASLGGGEAVPGVRSVSIEVQPGQAIAIVGAVGSGKSTLVAAILGEARALEGRVTFINASGAEVARPRTAYVPQEAYLINSSLRENLLFGADSDPELHVTDETLHEAMRLAAFENDFSRLRAGLATEIGERGVNLSGGQKQRVSLARAVVFRPQLVLLDDPLSAVDVRAESTIEDRLIFGEWAQSTRVVATHRLGGLARYDRVVFLARGGVVAQGGLGELLATCPEFRAFYADHERQSAEHLEPASATPAGVRAESAGQDHRVTEDEEREIGAVKGSVYLKYLTRLAGSRPSLRPWRLALLVGGALAVTGFPFLQRAWLAWSSNLQSGNGTPVSGFESVRALAADPVTSIWVYGALCFASLGVVLANRQYWLTRGMEAGREMHDSMLEATLAAPLRFFDSTPVGRILQRFSRDVEAVDLHLQWSFESTVRCAVQVVAAIALIAVSLPVTVFAIVPTLWIYERLQRQYRRPAREAKRLDSVSRSPRYAHFKETLQGLAVIRAYGRSNWFMHEFFDRLERSQRMFRGHYMLNRWFSSRVPILGGAISFATGAALTLAARSGRMSAGEAGLVATYAIGLWDYLNWGVRIFSEVESRMTSVERIDRYASLAPEPSVTKAARTPLRASWPEVGRIEFKNATARYASDLPPALAGLSFFVKAGARVGIVGRSGSGKSTALQALFRCVELESGSIEIDGVDIATVPLARLRRAIAAIPQDPTLFIGTVRDNLDREGVCTDLAIERALDLARMRDVVASLPGGLSAPVHENGANFSQGQRQLLCLARALLSGARIVTLDEATASVDVQTDAAIQDVVRTACNGVTMLIVAHRLGTVADCDTVIEIRDGAGIERPVYAALHSGGSSPVALDRLLSTSL